MIDFGEELDRLRKDDGSPPDKSLISIHVDCLADAASVLNRTKALLQIVLKYALAHPPDESVEPPDLFIVDVQYWLTVLPLWFFEKTPWNYPAMKSGEWSVESWLYWFIDPHEDRAWRWWSASIIDDCSIVAYVQVDEIPFPWGALQWAFLAAGATTAQLDF